MTAFERVLVTGADGFIGSHLTEILATKGYKVRALAYYNSFNSRGWLAQLPEELAASVEIVHGDVRDPGFVSELVKGCDAVLNLAALIAIPFSYQAPASYVDTNVTGTLNILQAAHKHGVGRVIQTSTSEVYGTANFVPITEDHPLNAQSPYAATKIASDSMALAFWASFSTPVVVIRPFNTYGPRQSARAVIPTIITQIANGKRQIRLGATHPTRDFNFVTDIVRGFEAALRAPADQVLGEVINLGSNFEISIGDTVAEIARVMGVDVEIIGEDQRLRPEKSEVYRLWASNAKAKARLNWEPEYAGLEGFRRGLAATAHWFEQPENLSAYKSEIYNV